MWSNQPVQNCKNKKHVTFQGLMHKFDIDIHNMLSSIDKSHGHKNGASQVGTIHGKSEDHHVPFARILARIILNMHFLVFFFQCIFMWRNTIRWLPTESWYFFFFQSYLLPSEQVRESDRVNRTMMSMRERWNTTTSHADKGHWGEYFSPEKDKCLARNSI